MSQTPPPARRYPRTANGLVGSMIVVVVGVLLFVGFRAVFSKNLEVKPERVDYLEAVGAAQGAGYRIAYPPSLPAGWEATSISFDPTSRLQWGIGILTADGTFVGLRQEDASSRDLLETYVDEDTTEGSPYTATGAIAEQWDTYTDRGGDRAYVSDLGEDTLMVYGSASAADQQELISLLTEQAYAAASATPAQPSTEPSLVSASP